MKIKSGDLTQKIQIMSFTDASDGAGGSIPTSSVYWETFASAIPYTSRVLNEANQQDLKDGFKFILRYRDDKSITQDMFVKYRGGLLKIISAPTDYVFKTYVEIRAIWQNRPLGNE